MLEVTALDGASLTARPGRLLGFLGPNGAARTTTILAATPDHDAETLDLAVSYH